MKKILTIIEGRVGQDDWSSLKNEYDKVSKRSLPNTLLNSYLVQDGKDSELWRIITIWESMDAMNAYRKSVETPAWILVFKSLNITPKFIDTAIVVEK